MIHQTALVFMTHRADPTVMDRFREMHSQTRHLTDSFVLLDAAKDGVEAAWHAYLVEHQLEGVRLVPFIFTHVVGALGVAPLKPDQIVPGSTHLPLIWLAQGLSHKHFWIGEDDVIYTGHWGEFLRLFDADESSLLCSHLCSYQQRRHWSWWSSLRIPDNLKASGTRVIAQKGFFPVYRISAVALGEVLQQQRSGWAGHHEVMIPTVLAHAGHSIKDLNDAARSVVYETGSMEPGDGSGELSSLRFRPPVTDADIAASAVPRIFHPLKPAATGPKFAKIKSFGHFGNTQGGEV